VDRLRKKVSVSEQQGLLPSARPIRSINVVAAREVASDRAYLEHVGIEYAQHTVARQQSAPECLDDDEAIVFPAPLILAGEHHTELPAPRIDHQAIYRPLQNRAIIIKILNACEERVCVCTHIYLNVVKSMKAIIGSQLVLPFYM
jgi:hypothetical protein